MSDDYGIGEEIARVVSSSERDGYVTVVVECPLCSDRHRHGGTRGERGQLGWKIRHCASNGRKPGQPRGYWVVDGRPVEKWEVAPA